MNEIDDVRMCPCCGQMRPYPTTPGIWEFTVDPALSEALGREPHWTTVEVKEHEEGLTITPMRSSEPIWWPNNAQWRKKS